MFFSFRQRRERMLGFPVAHLNLLVGQMSHSTRKMEVTGGWYPSTETLPMAQRHLFLTGNPPVGAGRWKAVSGVSMEMNPSGQGGQASPRAAAESPHCTWVLHPGTQKRIRNVIVTVLLRYHGQGNSHRRKHLIRTYSFMGLIRDRRGGKLTGMAQEH